MNPVAGLDHEGHQVDLGRVGDDGLGDDRAPDHVAVLVGREARGEQTGS